MQRILDGVSSADRSVQLASSYVCVQLYLSAPALVPRSLTRGLASDTLHALQRTNHTDLQLNLLGTTRTTSC